MHWLDGCFGILLIGVVLWDAFETIVLPRRIVRRYRLTRAFYRLTWVPWSFVARQMTPKRRERLLSFYGPLSLLMLILLWAVGLVIGFGLLHVGLGSQLSPASIPLSFSEAFYYSGTSLFTLGLGDIQPHGFAARMLSVLEAGTGFGFLALTIGYFPVLYQAFSRREVQISLLDARAGSPPTAQELLRRGLDDGGEKLSTLFAEWERWGAELMESHLSYPVLCYFRSQHDNESWLAALTTLLDTTALVISNAEGPVQKQAQLTFAIARHAIVDLSQVLGQAPQMTGAERISPEEARQMRQFLYGRNLLLSAEEPALHHFEDLRKLYEPYLLALSEFLLMPLPAFVRQHRPDNWETSAWGRITAGHSRIEELKHDEHL